MPDHPVRFDSAEAEHPAAAETRQERAARLRPHVARWVEVLGANEVAARTDMHPTAIKKFIRSRITPLDGALDAYEEMLASENESYSAYAGWTPTDVNISALPPPLRRFVLDLQDARDPERAVSELTELREKVRALAKLVEQIRSGGGGSDKAR